MYFGRTFTVEAEADYWQVVVCEHCDLEWAFRVRCGGVGTGKSPYFLDHDGAKERAQKQALRALEEDRRAVRSGLARNVGCPGCGRYQGEMVESLRRHYASSWDAVGLVGLLVGAMLLVRGIGDGQILAGGAGAAFVLAGAASMAWRRRLQRLYDPNATP